MFAEFTTGNWLALASLLVTIIVSFGASLRMYLNQKKEFVKFQTKTELELQSHRERLALVEAEIKTISDKYNKNHLDYLEKLDSMGNNISDKIDSKFEKFDEKIDSRFEIFDKKIEDNFKYLDSKISKK